MTQAWQNGRCGKEGLNIRVVMTLFFSLSTPPSLSPPLSISVLITHNLKTTPLRVELKGGNILAERSDLRHLNKGHIVMLDDCFALVSAC